PETGTSPVPDSVPDAFCWEEHPGPRSGTGNARETAADKVAGPDGPDVPDAPEPITHTHTPSPGVEGPTAPETPVSAGNGADRDAFAARHAVDPLALAAILDCRAEHPDWSDEKIRKALHIKKSVVDRVLREWDGAP